MKTLSTVRRRLAATAAMSSGGGGTVRRKVIANVRVVAVGNHCRAEVSQLMVVATASTTTTTMVVNGEALVGRWRQRASAVGAVGASDQVGQLRRRLQRLRVSPTVRAAATLRAATTGHRLTTVDAAAAAVEDDRLRTGGALAHLGAASRSVVACMSLRLLLARLLLRRLAICIGVDGVASREDATAAHAEVDAAAAAAVLKVAVALSNVAAAVGVIAGVVRQGNDRPGGRDQAAGGHGDEDDVVDLLRHRLVLGVQPEGAGAHQRGAAQLEEEGRGVVAALADDVQRKLVDVRRVRGGVHLEDVEDGVGQRQAVQAVDVSGEAEAAAGDGHLPDVLCVLEERKIMKG